MRKRIITGLRLGSIALFAVLLTAAGFSTAMARKNPAACYCEAMGYEYTVETTPEGEAGYCILSDNRKVDAWQFVLGQIAREYSYCAQNGYEMKTVYDWETCSGYGMPPCAVCILEDGREVEIIELMNLDLTEGECGDGVCAIGETYENCPEDCEKEANAEDDGSFPAWIIGVIIAGIVALGLAFFFMRQRRKKQNKDKAGEL
ncbi:MAG: DUF333 domain-containing protein [Dehalococcoidia bacterium]